MMIFLKSANNELVIEASGWLSANSVEKRLFLEGLRKENKKDSNPRVLAAFCVV
jgi:hypothetical protein